MTDIVLFRLSDDKSIYLADLEAGTVERRDASDITAENSDVTDLVTAIDEASDGEKPMVRGIDFALAARARPTAASHLYFPSR